MNGLVLPPELVELILQHLMTMDRHSLQSCALISWVWVIPCQRALFRYISLVNWSRIYVFHLLPHLRRYPHLQTLIRRIKITHTSDSMARNTYLSCLAALFPLMPRLTYLEIMFKDVSRSWDARDQQFMEAFNAFLHTCECLTDLVLRFLQDEADFQQMFLYLEGTTVKRVSLYTIHSRWDGPLPRVDFFSSTLSVVHLPAIELLRVGLADASLHAALSFWLRQYPTMFPNLKYLEVVIDFKPLDLQLGMWFRDILKPAALQLESLRLELTYYLPQSKEELPTNESLFEDLHVKHFQLCGKKAPWINWFSSMLRQLANSGTTVHFVELTFTFEDLSDVKAADSAVAWATIDEVLSYPAFNGVQRIHFEDDSHTRTLITDQAQPELASIIRRTLPHLASRGVLCFQ